MSRRVFQVNQNNITETSAGILCAPDDRRAGHEILRELRVGDLLFHYNSRIQRTHTISVVEPVNEEDPRLDPWRPLAILQRGTCFLAYSGRHLTQEQPPNRTRFLLAFARTLRTDLTLPNAFPSQQIYMRPIAPLEAGHRAIVDALREDAEAAHPEPVSLPLRALRTLRDLLLFPSTRRPPR